MKQHSLLFILANVSRKIFAKYKICRYTHIQRTFSPHQNYTHTYFEHPESILLLHDGLFKENHSLNLCYK